MGGGTGTGAAPVIARVARDMGILTVGVVTKPFVFEGQRRMRIAENGICELQKSVDTLIVIPNQNLFRVANEKTTFADAFAMADQVLYSGVACITDLMVKEGLINLDFADVRAIMREMGKAMMGTGESSGEKRAIHAAEAAIANPLLDEVSMKGARGLLISITGGNDLTLYEVDEAASRIRQEVDDDANIILGATFDQSLEGLVRVSVVATGIDQPIGQRNDVNTDAERIAEAARQLRETVALRPASEPPQSRYQQPIESERPAQAGAADAGQQGVVTQSMAGSLSPPVSQPAPAQPQPAMIRDVHIQPMQPKPTLFPEPPATPHYQEYRDAGPFIPPAPEQPMRAPRMPKTEDLPIHVQDQMRAQRGDRSFELPAAETRRRSLLEKLAAFGMSRQDETPPAPRQAQPLQAPPIAAPGRPAQHNPAQPNAVHAEYAKRQNPAAVRAPKAALDLHGRVNPQRSTDEDQLEIPAFLRRQQSN
jgi:cell division protein FtsZ